MPLIHRSQTRRHGILSVFPQKGKTICPAALIVAFTCIACRSAVAKDYFLTIGGGYAPSGNQVSLEKNVQLFQRVLAQQPDRPKQHDVLFADGNSPGRDLQVIDRESVPLANRLMAEFFGDQSDLGLTYRNHDLRNVRASAKPINIRNWFDETAKVMVDGDRLFIYVTAHGNRSSDRSEPFDTTIALWDNTSIKMTEFTELLDRLPQNIDVVAVMVQCYAGGFARLPFVRGNSKKGLSKQRRVGFFATVHDRPAAGCTPDVDEANYVEYSTYFWAALQGVDRAGRPIQRPDYDSNGIVSFDEAHAYTILNAVTIDLPTKTSGEYLSIHSRMGKKNDGLLTDETGYDVVLSLANPVQTAILEGLSERLKLNGDGRIDDAWEFTKQRGRRSRGRRPTDQVNALKQRISRSLQARWPELANVLNPLSVEFLTTRRDEFIGAVERHADYKRYRELTDDRASAASDAETKVLHERFLRIVDNVILTENLTRLGNETRVTELQAILAAESGSL